MFDCVVDLGCDCGRDIVSEHLRKMDCRGSRFSSARSTFGECEVSGLRIEMRAHTKETVQRPCRCHPTRRSSRLLQATPDHDHRELSGNQHTQPG